MPLAAMVVGTGRPATELLSAGYALSVDPMSAQALAFRAMKAGYEGILSGEGFGITGPEVLEVVHEIGETISVESLYEIEAVTTEREAYG